MLLPCFKLVPGMNSSAIESRRFSSLRPLSLALALVGAAAMLYYHLGWFMPRVLEAQSSKNLAGGYAFGNDFYPVWLTTREWARQRSDPYSPEMTREIQEGLFGRPLDPKIPTDPLTDYRTFAYPAFTDLLFWPTSGIPFPILRVLLVCLLALLTVASVWIWIRALSWRVTPQLLVIIILLVVFSYPVLEGLYAGQLGLVVGFLLGASLMALQRGRFLLAGILSALTTIKPQMTVLALLYLLLWSLGDWRSRKGFCLGLLGTILTLVAGAMLVWPHWISQWTNVVWGYHRYAKPPLVDEVLAAPLGPGFERLASLAMIALLILVAIGLAWRNRAADANSFEFWRTLSALLCITAITLLPGQALHDHVILLPGIFLISSGWRDLASDWIRKALLIIGVAILLWPWLAASALIALRPLLSTQLFYSKSVFALPLRTAAVFPFVVTALVALAFRLTGEHREDGLVNSSPS
jgi:Glycosyltransferase family 87